MEPRCRSACVSVVRRAFRRGARLASLGVQRAATMPATAHSACVARAATSCTRCPSTHSCKHCSGTSVCLVSVTGARCGGWPTAVRRPPAARTPPRGRRPGGRRGRPAPSSRPTAEARGPKRACKCAWRRHQMQSRAAASLLDARPRRRRPPAPLGQRGAATPLHEYRMTSRAGGAIVQVRAAAPSLSVSAAASSVLHTCTR